MVDKIALSVDSTHIKPGESFQLAVVSEGSGGQGVNLGRLDIPGTEKFLRIGTSSSTQMMFVNGQSQVSTEMILTLVGNEEGNFTIGPVVVDFQEAGKGRQVQSNVVEVRVGGNLGGLSQEVRGKKKELGPSSHSTKGNSMASPDKGEGSDGVLWSKIIRVVGALLILGGGLGLWVWNWREEKQRRKQRQTQVRKTEKEGGVKPIKIPRVSDSDFYEQVRAGVEGYLARGGKDQVAAKEILGICDAHRYGGVEGDRELVRKRMEQLGV